MIPWELSVCFFVLRDGKRNVNNRLGFSTRTNCIVFGTEGPEQSQLRVIISVLLKD